MRDFFDASFAIPIFVIITIFTANTISTRGATLEGSFETLPLQHVNYSVAKKFVADTQHNPKNLTVFSKMNSAELAGNLSLPREITVSISFSTLLQIDASKTGSTVDVQLSGLTDLSGTVTLHRFSGGPGNYLGNETKVTSSIGIISFTPVTGTRWIVFAQVGSASAAFASPAYQVVDELTTPVHMINRAGHVSVSTLPPQIFQELRIGQTLFIDGGDVAFLIPSFTLSPLLVGASTTTMVATYFQEPCIIRVDII